MLFIVIWNFRHQERAIAWILVYGWPRGWLSRIVLFSIVNALLVLDVMLVRASSLTSTLSYYLIQGWYIH